MLTTEATSPARQSETTADISPLMLSDRLIGLAQDADRAGMRRAASRLVRLACDVLDPPKPARRRSVQ